MRGRSSSTEAGELLARLRSALTERIGSARFGMWFGDAVQFVHIGRELLVVVQTPQHQLWLEQTFQADLQAATEKVYGIATRARVVLDPAVSEDPPPLGHSSSQPPIDQRDLFGDKSNESSKKGEAKKLKKPARRFRSLQDFVVGATNRVAHAYALAVVEDPGQGANPIVIHGPVGTGKTHLLEGIYTGLRKLWPEDRPVFVTAEEFTTRFVQSMRFNKQEGFRRQFRDCSALLLDDLDFLARMPKTQEEFLHTFDVLHSEGKQIVVTMDCHPRLLDELMTDLQDRLMGGGVCGLLPPDEPTRLEILRKKSTGPMPLLSEELLKYLAKNLSGNVRELEGAINSIRHYARVTGKSVDLALVREALGDLIRHTVRTITLPDVDAAVCKVLRLPSGALQSKARSWAVSHPRMLAIYLARKLTAATYGEISKHFGAKTHSTAVASEKRVRIWIQADEVLCLGEREWRVKDILERIERELQR